MTQATSYASILKKAATSYASILKKDKSQDYKPTMQVLQHPTQEKQEWFTIGKGGKPIRQSSPAITKR